MGLVPDRTGVARSLCAGLVVGFVAHASLHAAAVRADDRWPSRIADALRPRSIDGVATRAWPSSPLLDEARAQIGVELAWEHIGSRGRGATICVVDTGVDLTHRDLLDEGGGTRVRWLLELDAEPRGVHDALERAVGAVWSREEIDDALARDEVIAPDWHGHGTSIASAAAGDDSPSVLGDPGFRAGVAPQAELVIVRALRRGALGFHDDDVVRAARFCVDARVSDPARTVVLLALGGHDGPHDGTSAYERAISAITATGAAVVVAAGNDGDRALHASAWLVGREPASLTVRLPPSEIDDGLVAIAVRGAREVRARLEGQSFTAWTSRGANLDTTSFVIDATDTSTTYVIAHGALASGDLVIEARGAADEGGALDAWIVEARLGDALFSPRFVGPSARASEQVRIPATADGVIAVGASVSRDFLAGEDRPGLTLEADEAGRASFSSRGPRVDGAPLPTVIAPGGWIVAARSSALDPADAEALFGGDTERFEAARRGEDRLAVAGTSVAAAIVAGAIALDRSRTDRPREDLTVGDSSALSASALGQDGALVPFDARVGAGLIDVPGYLARRTDEGALDGDALELGCTRDPITPSARDLFVVVRSRAGGEARVRARVVGDSWSGTRTMLGGYVALPLTVPVHTIGESLDVEVEVGGRLVRACSVRVGAADDEAPLVLGGAGGCAIQPIAHRRAGPSAVAVAFSLVVFARLRSRSRRGGLVLRSRP